MPHAPLVTLAVVAAAASAAAGCWGSEATEFPPGLEPLEDNTAPAPQGGAYTETIAFADGQTDRYTWVHARGHVLAAPAVVWDVAKDAERVVARCATDRHAITVGIEPEYEYSFQVSYVVERVITIAWDERWRYGTLDGTPAAPARAIVRYQKVYGSTLIELIQGSIQVVATDDPSVTELQFIEHLSAAGGGASDIRASMSYRFEALVAAAHGRGQPPCP